MDRRKNQPIASAALLLALLAPATASAAWFGSLELGVLHDDNLGRAELSSDIESDSALRVVLERGRAFEFEQGRGLTLTARAAYTAHDQFGDLDNLALGVSAALRKKSGLGPTAPTVRLTGTIERQSYDAANREGWFYAGALSWGRRVNDRWSFETALSYDILRADQVLPAGPGGMGPGPGPGPAPGPAPGPVPGPGPGPGDEAPGDVFDQERLSLSLSADYTLGGAWLLGLGYVYRDGDVASTAIPNDRIVAAAKAITDDPAFGAGRFAYRLEAEVHTLAIDLDRTIGPSSSLVIAYELQQTKADGGIDYDKSLLRLSWVRSF